MMSGNYVQLCQQCMLVMMRPNCNAIKQIWHYYTAVILFINLFVATAQGRMLNFQCLPRKVVN